MPVFRGKSCGSRSFTQCHVMVCPLQPAMSCCNNCTSKSKNYTLQTTQHGLRMNPHSSHSILQSQAPLQQPPVVAHAKGGTFKTFHNGTNWFEVGQSLEDVHNMMVQNFVRVAASGDLHLGSTTGFKWLRLRDVAQ